MLVMIWLPTSSESSRAIGFMCLILWVNLLHFLSLLWAVRPW